MEAFRNGESSVLITTNVLARGVDVDNVCLVVNYDVPIDKDQNPDFETYLHRIGRTGRFGRKGTAINLVNDQKSIETLAAIEAHFSTGGKEMIANAPADPEETQGHKLWPWLSKPAFRPRTGRRSRLRSLGPRW